jgi:23S rRNA pseudouridine1911/1915/1917 synthase
LSKIQQDGTADARRRPEPQEGPLSILYEDDAVLVLDKPAGLVIHPTYKHPDGTLLNAVLWRVRDRAGAQPGILTRLDKDTSGIVVIALTAEIHARMQRDAQAGRVRKEYLALVRGVPDPSSGFIDLPLARDPQDRRRVIATPGGAASRTRYEIVTTHDETSVVRCELVTGRTHQIRVHLASRGWPVIGDATYGVPDPRLARQALHAWRVTLPHPLTRDVLVLESPLPRDLRPVFDGTSA